MRGALRMGSVQEDRTSISISRIFRVPVSVIAGPDARAPGGGDGGIEVGRRSAASTQRSPFQDAQVHDYGEVERRREEEGRDSAGVRMRAQNSCRVMCEKPTRWRGGGRGACTGSRSRCSSHRRRKSSAAVVMVGGGGRIGVGGRERPRSSHLLTSVSQSTQRGIEGSEPLSSAFAAPTG